MNLTPTHNHKTLQSETNLCGVMRPTHPPSVAPTPTRSSLHTLATERSRRHRPAPPAITRHDTATLTARGAAGSAGGPLTASRPGRDPLRAHSGSDHRQPATAARSAVRPLTAPPGTHGAVLRPWDGRSGLPEAVHRGLSMRRVKGCVIRC